MLPKRLPSFHPRRSAFVARYRQQKHRAQDRQEGCVPSADIEMERRTIHAGKTGSDGLLHHEVFNEDADVIGERRHPRVPIDRQRESVPDAEKGEPINS